MLARQRVYDLLAQGRLHRHHEGERDPITDRPKRNARVLLSRAEVAALVRAEACR